MRPKDPSSYRYYRRMKTTQERRLNCSEEHAPYVRGRRRNLPNYWDEISRKGTSKKAKKLYDNRGKKHSVFIENLKYTYELEQSLKDLNIRFKLTPVNRKIPFQREKYEYRPTGQYKTVLKYWCYHGSTKNPHNNPEKRLKENPVLPVYEKKEILEKVLVGYVEDYRVETLGYILTWWSDKDIGLEFILNSLNYHSRWFSDNNKPIIRPVDEYANYSSGS